MIITLLLVAGAAILVPRVKVNSDMTAYLPDDSQMKQGISIITDNFNAGHLNNANVKIMFEGLSAEQRKDIASELGLRDEVHGVTYEVSADSLYTKYDLLVSPSIDQKAFGHTLRQSFPQKPIVETSQDGATPPLSALIIAGALILIILIIMAQSWIEPLIYLFTIGVAVILNIGTNAFLPSVSITTNYIVAILQLVLSLDYAIVLSNRYRQALQPDRSLLDSMNLALKSASPAIISSAMTTIVGLAMLAFMRVKIGLDLGIVLGKGVLCSLVTTFTLLPSLLMLCNKAIMRTGKKTFVIPTDRLGRFATHHKISLTISSVVLFFLAFYYSRQTDIYFNTNTESRIEQVFPKTNTFVAVYTTADENAIIPLADSLKRDSSVKAIISYPTLLKQQYTANELVQYIYKMSIDMADYMPPMDVAMLTPEMMQTIYYMRSHAADTLHIAFPDLMKFVQLYCIDNPMFSSVISPEMRSQMQLFQKMIQSSSAEDDEPIAEPQLVAPVKVSVEPMAEPVPVQETRQQPIAKTNPETIRIRDFLPRLYSATGSEMAGELLRLSDTTQLDKPKTVRQMADFIGSTMFQTKMVYSFSQNGKRMTPLQYVHFLTDDLFQRPSLAKLVNAEQKEGLIVRTRIMDASHDNASIPADELTTLLNRVGIDLTKERVLAIAGHKPAQEPAASNPSEPKPVVIETPIMALVSPAPTPTPAPAPRRKTKAERQAAEFERLMYGGHTYTCDQMAHHFHNLGQTIDPAAINMLYCYYGSINAYNDSLSMSPEQLLAYVADTLVKLDVIASILDSSSISAIDLTRTQLSEAVSMLSHDDYSLLIVMSSLPAESKQTYAFVDHMHQLMNSSLVHPAYIVGESVMFSELKHGFTQEMTFITLLTILAIFLIVALTFRSIIVPTILVMTVMTAVYVNVVVSGWISGQMLYLAYLIVQSILMGATIDYGILYANYYKENRRTMAKYDAATEAYHGSVRTITTSGLIMVLGPGAMALLINDVTIQAIVGCISIGALMAILLILFVLPGVLVAFDKLVVPKSIRSLTQSPKQ